MTTLRLKPLPHVDQNLTAPELAGLEATGMNSLTRGWRAGRLGTEINAGLAEEASLRASGQQAAADALAAKTTSLRQLAGAYAPDVGRVEQINGLGDAGSWLAGQVGQGAASMLDPVVAGAAVAGAGQVLSMAPGTVGAVGKGLRTVGAFAAPYAINQQQMKGEVYGAFKDDPTIMQGYTAEQLNDRANVYGAAAGALDTVLPGMVGRSLAGGALRQAARPQMGALARTGLGMASEGATELAQTEGSIQLRGLMNPERDTSGDFSDRLNAFAGGAAGGAPFAAAGAIADSAYGGARRVGEKVKDAAGTTIGLAKDGVSDATEAVAKRGRTIWPFGRKGAAEQDLATGLRESSAAPASSAVDDLHLMMGQPSPSENVNTDDPEAFRAWWADASPRRSTMVSERLQKLAEDGDQRAAQILAGIADPETMDAAIEAGADHVVRAGNMERLAQQAEMAARGERRQKAVAGVGEALGRAGRTAATAAAKTVSSLAKGVAQGARKQNLQSDPQLEAMREADRQAGAKALDEQKAAARSKERAQLFGEYLANQARMSLPGRADPGKVKYESVEQLMREVGTDLSDLAESWSLSNALKPHEVGAQYAKDRARELKAAPAMPDRPSDNTYGPRNDRAMRQQLPGPGTLPAVDGDKRGQQFDNLKLHLNSLAQPIVDLVGENAPAVVNSLRDMARKTGENVDPFFDFLEAEVTALADPRRGMAHSAEVRAEAARQVVSVIDAPTQARLLKEGIDLSSTRAGEELLTLLERLGRGQADPGFRRELTRLLGADNLKHALGVVQQATPDDVRLDQEFRADDEGAFEGLVQNDNGEWVESYEQKQAQKEADLKPNAKMYGFYGTPKPRSSLDNADPLARNLEKVTKRERDEWAEMTSARRAEGLPVDPETDPVLKGGRPRLFNLAEDGEHIAKRQQAMAKQLKVDPTPERMLEMLKEEGNKAGAQVVERAIAEQGTNPKAKEWLADRTDAFFTNRAGNWRFGTSSAWDMMEELGLHKITRLVRRADYLRQEASRYKESDPERASEAKAKLKTLNDVISDLKDQEAGQRPSRIAPGDRRTAMLEAREFLQTHGMVVAERGIVPDDPQTISADRIIRLGEGGQKTWENSRRNDRLAAYVLHFKSDLAGSKDGMLRVDSRQLAKFARKARWATTETNFEADESFSDTKKDDEYLADLMDGIAGMVASGHVEGLPFVETSKGRETFSPKSAPGSLPLVTTTVFGLKGRKKVAAKDKSTITDPTSPAYQEETSAEQDVDWNVPDDRDKNAGSDPYQVWGKLSNVMKVAGAQTGDGSTLRAAVSETPDARSPEYKTTDPDAVPSEFERQNPKAEPDEFSDQRNRSMISRHTAFDQRAVRGGELQPREMHDDGRKLGTDLADAMRQDFSAAMDEAKALLRSASRPRRAKRGTNDVAGGAHYVAPIFYALGSLGGDSQLTAREALALDNLRATAAKVLLDSDLKPADKVILAREIAPNASAPALPTMLKGLMAMGEQMDLESAWTPPKSKAQRAADTDAAVAAYRTGFNVSGPQRPIAAPSRLTPEREAVRNAPAAPSSAAAMLSADEKQALIDENYGALDTDDKALDFLRRARTWYDAANAAPKLSPQSANVHARLKTLFEEDGYGQADLGMFLPDGSMSDAEVRAAIAAPKEGAAPVGKSQARPSGAAGRKLSRSEWEQLVRDGAANGMSSTTIRRILAEGEGMSSAERKTLESALALVKVLQDPARAVGGAAQQTVDGWVAKYASGTPVTVVKITVSEAEVLAASLGAHGATAASLGGVYIPADGRHFVVTVEGGQRDKGTALARLAHEFGHALQKIAFDGAAPAVKARITAAYEADLASGDVRRMISGARLGMGEDAKMLNAIPEATAAHLREEMLSVMGQGIADTPGAATYINSFPEWFAEQFSKYVTADLNRSLGVPERAFWRKLVNDLQGFFKNVIQALKPNLTFEKWADSLVPTAGAELGASGPYAAKDQAKSSVANKFIGRGSAASSTAKYAQAWGARANTGAYSPSDRVFVSAEGQRAGRIDPDFAELAKATAAGATLLTDNEANRVRAHNVGERQVAEFLREQGYAEQSPGVWRPRKLNRQDARKSDPSRVFTAEEIAQAKDYVQRVLGAQVRVDFKEITGYSGEWIEADNLIEISTTAAAGAMQTTYHEALHAFFSKFVKNSPEAFRVLQGLADNQKILGRLTALLHKYPEAQAQLVDGEERLAYLYQFWAAGLLDLPTKPTTLFGKVGRFFARVFGRITDDERATAILEAFHAGKFSEPSVAGRVIQEALSEGTMTTRALRKYDRVLSYGRMAAYSAAMTLERSDSKEAQALIQDYWTNPGAERDGQAGEGYINAKQRHANQYINLMSAAIRGLTARDLVDVTRYLENQTPFDEIPYAPHRKAAESINNLLKRFREYMVEERGMEIGDAGDRYFPRVWDAGLLGEKGPEFVDMLVSKYADRLQHPSKSVREVAEALHVKLLHNTVDKRLMPSRDDGVLAPFFASAENRELPWLEQSDIEPYLAKDLVHVLTTYFHNGARAAEYTARFGQRGEMLDARLKTIENELLEHNAGLVRAGEITREEASARTAREMKAVHKAIGAMEGTLGNDIGSKWREASAWMTVYQNVRLLPLALFASVVDPLGMVARGAPMREAYDTFLRSMREVFTSWGDMFRDEPKERQADKWEKLALAVGSVEAAMFSHHVAEEYASTYMNRKAKAINDTFFRLNGMEAWNRGMRSGATRSAAMFIARHSKGEDKIHSARWLKELGLTAADVTLDADGELVTDWRELAALKELPEAEAKRQIDKLYVGINRWVQGAVLTPNAAQRPSWASDPHYSIFFHLKQFSYSFHQTILRRAVKELNYGNLVPMGSFAWYIPVMIASDVTKGLLQGGGTLPAHMQGMSLGDWFLRGAERAGVLGIGQIGVDSAESPISLAGPAAEQLIDSFDQPVGRTVVDALPANSAYRHWL